jgi:hypothetical protein
VLVEAAEIAKKAQQEELAKGALTVQRQKIQLDVLEHELMMGVIGLDWATFPEAKLNIIKACYVVNGTLKSGREELIIPKESGLGQDGPGTYTAHFNRLGLDRVPEQPESPAAPSSEVFDLIPGTPPVETIHEGLLPLPGESIDEAPAKPKNSRIISVEVD